MSWGAYRGADVGVPEDELPFIHDQQLTLPGLGPEVGEQWRRKDGKAIASVISTAQRRHGWVTVRIHGKPQTLKLATFERQFERV